MKERRAAGRKRAAAEDRGTITLQIAALEPGFYVEKLI